MLAPFQWQGDGGWLGPGKPRTQRPGVVTDHEDLKFYSEDLVPELIENITFDSLKTCPLGSCSLTPSRKESHDPRAAN